MLDRFIITTNFLAFSAVLTSPSRDDTRDRIENSRFLKRKKFSGIVYLDIKLFTVITYRRK